MAFVDDENLDPNAPAPSGGGSTLVSGQGGSSNAHAGTSPSSPNSPGGMPGNFVGIQQYLNANQPQSSKLAGQVGGYVNDLGSTARQAVSNASGQFQGAVDQNTVNLDQNLYNEAQANPQQVASNAAKKSEFQKEYNASYGGPSTFEGSDYYNPALKATQTATDATTLLGSPEGQKQVVSNVEKKTGGYSTPGAQSFDTLLLQGAPNARSVIDDTVKNNSDLKANLDAAAAEQNKRAQNAAATTAATGQTYQGTFGNQQLQDAIQKSLMGKAETANTTANTTSKSIVDKLMKNQPLTPQELQSLDINQANLSKIQEGEKYVPDLTPYAGTTPTNVTGQQIATPEDYARYQALNQLTGQNANFLSNPSLAGSANLNGVKPFDLNKYLTDVATAQKSQEDKAAAANKPGAPGSNPNSNAARADAAISGATIAGMPGAQIGAATPEIKKAGSSVSSTAKRAGGAVKKVFSDRNLKTNIEKFDASSFLDSLMGAKHG